MNLDSSLKPFLDQKWIENVNILLVRRSSLSKEFNSTFNYRVCVPESENIAYVTGFREYFGRRPKRLFLPNDVLRFSDFDGAWRHVLPLTTTSMTPNLNADSSVTPFVGRRSVVPILSQNLTRANMLKKHRGASVTANATIVGPNDAPFSADEPLQSDVALRIAALRCIFVKTGLLLIENRHPNVQSHIGAGICYDRSELVKLLRKYRERVRAKPEEFLRIFTDELTTVSPRLTAVQEWWNWISPTTVGKIPRYDTLFYFCSIDDAEYGTTVLTAETPQNWLFLDRLFADYSRHRFVILPSQLYEITRLGAHHDFDSLKQFALEREQRGIYQWIPSISIYKDGCVAALPGDWQYPVGAVEMMPSKTARLHDNKSMEEFRGDNDKQDSRDKKLLNRIELRSYWCRIVVSNCSIDETPKLDAYSRQSLGHSLPQSLVHDDVVHIPGHESPSGGRNTSQPTVVDIPESRSLQSKL